MKISETYLADSSTIFYYIIQNANECPFLDVNNLVIINQTYYYMNSGDKNISALYQKLLDKNSALVNKIEKTNEESSKICVAKYYEKWLKLYNNLVTDAYNALENYSRTKESLQQTNTNLSNTEDIDTNTFGFDTTSTDGVPKDKSSKVGSITGDAEDNYISRESSEHGNDGKFSKQELLQQEIDVRKNNFYDIMFADIDRVIANRIYEED